MAVLFHRQRQHHDPPLTAPPSLSSSHLAHRRRIIAGVRCLPFPVLLAGVRFRQTGPTTPCVYGCQSRGLKRQRDKRASSREGIRANRRGPAAQGGSNDMGEGHPGGTPNVHHHHPSHTHRSITHHFITTLPGTVITTRHQKNSRQQVNLHPLRWRGKKGGWSEAAVRID